MATAMTTLASSNKFLFFLSLKLSRACHHKHVMFISHWMFVVLLDLSILCYHFLNGRLIRLSHTQAFSARNLSM